MEQVEKLKIHEMKEMKDDDFKLLSGFDYRQTDRVTDICEWHGGGHCG